MDMRLHLPSTIESISFGGHELFLKRDDLIHSDFSGNKARKFHYFLVNDFPNIQKVISYGSNQSNAMYSLSLLAKMKGWEFDYFVDHISKYLQENPQGNFKAALENGMKIQDKNKIADIQVSDEILFIEEGGRQSESEYGISMLAEEIWEWQNEQNIETLNVFLPSGTGTTALFLQKNSLLLNKNTHFKTKIFTTPCVGDAGYLKKQFLELESDESLHPTIVESQKRFHFGKLYREYYKIWLELRHQTGVEFDLLYDPKGWLVLLDHTEIFMHPTLYLHQGGVLGNASMLPRYRRKFKDMNFENIL